MNEASARKVVLVRAFETGQPGSAWSEADAAWASRAAAEVVGSDVGPERFLARRAELAVERLGERERAVPRTIRAVTWRPWIGWVLVVGAFAVGVATDYIGPAHRVNVLAFPLLALIAWNLLVYAFIAGRAVLGLLPSRTRTFGPLTSLVARLGRGMQAATAVAAPDSPLTNFGRDWFRASMPLTAARVSRTLHLSALTFALGALAALYLRGLVLEYRAGWESTFLGAAEVHRLLSLVLGPASRLSGIPLPGVEQLDTIRFSMGPGENAAPWIHLYAVTIVATVVIPRAVLALVAWIAQSRREGHLRLPVDDAYYQRLLRGFTGETARVRLLPYSFQLPPQSALALKEIVTRVFGSKGEVSIARAVAFGDEDALPADLLPAEPLALAAPLFNLTATPETENHGAFVAAVAKQLQRGMPFAVLIDEAGFRQRFSGQDARLEERRKAWRDMLATQRAEPVFVDLGASDPGPSAAALTAALDRIARGEGAA